MNDECQTNERAATNLFMCYSCDFMQVKYDSNTMDTHAAKLNGDIWKK